MARIRSIHPGFWTDEAFAALSDAATLFYVGLLNEADDNGVFEWKPLTLRMRLRPAKEGRVEDLLAELIAGNVICRFDCDGRAYGAVRNFRRYQKPRFPKPVHPLTEAIGIYVGPPATAVKARAGDGEAMRASRIAETGRDEPMLFPADADSATLMEEGGGEGVGVEDGAETGSLREPSAASPEISRQMKNGGLVSGPTSSPEISREMNNGRLVSGQPELSLDALEAACRAAGLEASAEPVLADLSPIATLIAAGYDLARDVLPKLRAAKAAGKRGRTWAYYVPAITEGRAANARIPVKAKPTPAKPMRWVLHDSSDWAAHAARYRRQYRRDPPRVAGLGGMGWHFPVGPPEGAAGGATP